VPAGCNPVRVALSPAGDRAYVTARGSNALLVFDTAKLKPGNGDALIATITVGTAPVGVAAVGNMVIVTNSDRFGRGKSENQTLTVIAADKIGLAADPVIGTVEVRAFPRELHVTADGKALLVANAGSSSLMLFRLSDMPVKSGSPAAAQ
jgi:YVTN family beta-propeller protein